MATPALAESEPAAHSMSAAAIDVRLSGVRKTYGDVVAVDRVDLEIPAGEFFTLLGPSGSGKTTTLRLIAGFERLDEGRIELAGERGGDAGMPQVPHVLGAVHRARGAGLRAAGRIAAGRMPAPAVDRLRAERAGLRVPAEIIRLAARLVVGAHRVVIAGHGEDRVDAGQGSAGPQHDDVGGSDRVEDAGRRCRGHTALVAHAAHHGPSRTRNSSSCRFRPRR